MNKLRIIILSILWSNFLCSTTVFGQIGIKPLEGNPNLQAFIKDHPNYQWNRGKLYKWGQKDTLELPFFEDFTSTTIYPDSSKWLDNDVYVNRHFALKPPSYGVATFDFLDYRGFPYKTLQKDLLGGGDTLTSQAINLDYGPSDSVYLSFYYQARGYGDLIKTNDSLKLLFLNDSGEWRQVWAQPGNGFTGFVQVMLPIKDLRYLHTAFQFRFVNWTHYWGNNNHWHIDHIYLNKNRNVNDLSADDYAIQTLPTSLLQNYSVMPYHQFAANPSKEAADSISVRISNLNNRVITAVSKYEESQNGSVLAFTNYSDNSGLMPASSSVERRFPSYNLTGLNGFPVVIDRTYFVKESARTNPLIYQSNDKIQTAQVFERYYAYDDGSAETGFGFNDLRQDEGHMLVRYSLNTPDTLRAIGMFFTHNITNVSGARFNVEVWQSIARPGQADKMLLSMPVSGPMYTEEINGFHYFILPEPLLLEAGDFYIGWSQGDDYNLAMGFDKNGGNLQTGLGVNKDIYFNVGTGWQENSNGDLVGVPMIRPLVGKAEPYTASIKNIPQSFNLYPNPSNGKITITPPERGDWNQVEWMSMDGKTFGLLDFNGSVIDLSGLSSGVYLIRLTDGIEKTAYEKVTIH
jgi:hypothetical protein